MSTTSIEGAARIEMERLALADWRRRTGELYAQVRELARTDPAAAHAHWREVREGLFRGHVSSPLPPDRRRDFHALHFPYDPALRFEVRLVPDETPGAPTPAPAPATAPAPEPAPGGIGGLLLPISTGRQIGFDRIGWLDIPFASGPRRLALYWLPEYSGGLFLPFRDGTNGHETYGGGRYLLDTAKGADLGGDPADGSVVVDFNFAFQPSCAFDPHWSCPLSPPDNRLDIEIRAGERIA